MAQLLPPEEMVMRTIRHHLRIVTILEGLLYLQDPVHYEPGKYLQGRLPCERPSLTKAMIWLHHLLQGRLRMERPPPKEKSGHLQKKRK